MFAVAVLAITTVWAYVGREWTFQTLATAMYFPAILSFLFVDNAGDFLRQILGQNQVTDRRAMTFSCCVLVYVY